MKTLVSVGDHEPTTTEIPDHGPLVRDSAHPRKHLFLSVRLFRCPQGNRPVIRAKEVSEV